MQSVSQSREEKSGEYMWWAKGMTVFICDKKDLENIIRNEEKLCLMIKGISCLEDITILYLYESNNTGFLVYKENTIGITSTQQHIYSHSGKF